MRRLPRSDSAAYCRDNARPADIRAAQVLETWIDGKRVYMKGVKP
jgi:hypothetical protein